MNTRKYPRTMQEAFGPYASGPISEPEEDKPNIVLVDFCLALTLILGALTIVAVLV